MGILNLFDFVKRNKEIVAQAYDFDFDEIDSKAQNVYLKRMALDICANFLARAVSQSEILIDDENWYYKLNVRPNTDESATQFWHRFVYKLIEDNKVLAVMTDTGDILIADSWLRNEYAIYEDTFENVIVKDYQFQRKFRMNEVIYLEYNNQKLNKFTEGLFDDYAELYGRLIEAAKRNNQIRGTVDIETASGALDEEKTKELQGYIDKLFNAFKNKSIAIAPLFKGFTYSEHTKDGKSSMVSIDEINKILQSLIDIVADAIGIPTALLHGTRAELKDNMIAFNKYCLAALLQKIEDELNAKIYEPHEYTREKHISVIGINKPNIFEMAESIEKLISSGTFNPNEIRKELGHKGRKGGDKYVRTKNYETEEEGGD